MCGGVHYGEVEGLVSVERWSCSGGASCVVEYRMGRLRDWSLCLVGSLPNTRTFSIHSNWHTCEAYLLKPDL